MEEHSNFGGIHAVRNPLPFLIGESRGSLTLLGRIPGARKFAAFSCNCGSIVIRIAAKVLSGHTASCGCARVTHGHTGTPTFKSWESMKQRCLNPKSPGYARYGGRGITVCQQWVNSFSTFLSDMGTRPSIYHSLERINNDDGYSPDNCRWALAVEQASNRSNTKRVAHNGDLVCISELARRHGMPIHAVHARLKRGWCIERAVSQPLRHANRTDE